VALNIPGDGGGSFGLLTIMRDIDTNQARVVEPLRESSNPVLWKSL
jgi:hypothetical protein